MRQIPNHTPEIPVRYPDNVSVFFFNPLSVYARFRAFGPGTAGDLE